jgi:soluble lytic murein transglycosylase-like protein
MKLVQRQRKQICALSWLWRGLFASLLCLGAAHASNHSKTPGVIMDQCIASAAQFHRVDPRLLKAILMVESRLNPKAVNYNTNGTKDIGVAQVNTIHLATLEKHGIGEKELQDGCVNTYVGAWLLRKQISRYGLNWFGIAAYHSVTPDKNYRYQVLVYNEMVRSGAIQNIAMTVPPLSR